MGEKKLIIGPRRGELKKDFFISYTSADRSWAEWIAWELEEAGYTTVHQAWDFMPGANFVSEMKKALEDCERTIAVYSPNYFNSGFGEDEWTAAFADRSLVPTRVRECEIPKLLRTRVYVDLVNLGEAGARSALLEGLKRDRIKPLARPEFPGTGAKPRRYPGALPEVWEVPQPRNQNFTGRDQMLRDLHEALRSARPTAVAGLSGVGKTQLALEYAYRYASEYNLVWWLRAEQPSTLASDFAGMAAALNLPEKVLASQPEIIAAVRRWLEHNSGWLLVFDNAPSPEQCEGYRPRSNSGHVLITSRNPAWRGTAEPLAVQQLSRDESIAFLKKRTGRDEPDAALALGEAVGDLPIALEHAGAYIESTGASIEEYLELYGSYSKELLEPVQATWSISLEKLRSEDAAALDLLNLAAWLAPDNIPRDLLQAAGGTRLAFNKSIEALRRYSLIQAGDGGISVHRLVQKVTRDRLDEPGQRCWAEAALKLVNGAFTRLLDSRNWNFCVRLLPHADEITNHAEALSVALEECSELLGQAAQYEQSRGQLRRAEQFARRALKIDEYVYGTCHAEVATDANNLGQILREQGDLAGALHYTRLALEIDEKVNGPEHPEVAIRASNLGAILKLKGDLDGALLYTRRALEIDEKVYGPDHVDVGIRANNLGQILRAKGDLEGALKYTRRALAIDERAYGKDDPEVATDAHNVGEILREQGDLDGALEYSRRALAIDERAHGPDHPSVARDANSVARILKAEGGLDGALQYARRALEIDESVYGSDHPNVARDADTLGQILKARGDLGSALEYMRRALKIFGATYGPDNPATKALATSLSADERNAAAGA